MLQFLESRIPATRSSRTRPQTCPVLVHRRKDLLSLHARGSQILRNGCLHRQRLEWFDEPETKEKPFILYLSYNAPHYPLHAWPEDIAKYEGVYDDGYQAIQESRYQRQVDMGLIDPKKSPLVGKPQARDWNTLSDAEKETESTRMEIYAAMLDRVDQNIGKVLDKLREQGRLDNTLIFFASDNGACAETTGANVVSMAPEDVGKVASFDTVGEDWAIIQNTPFRYYKNYSHEGGICTPFIAYWPKGLKTPAASTASLLTLSILWRRSLISARQRIQNGITGRRLLPCKGLAYCPLSRANGWSEASRFSGNGNKEPPSETGTTKLFAGEMTGNSTTFPKIGMNRETSQPKNLSVSPIWPRNGKLGTPRLSLAIEPCSAIVDPRY